MAIRIRLLLAALMVMIAFSAIVASSALKAFTNGEEAGALGRVALDLAVMPIIVTKAVDETREYLSGEGVYKNFVVPRPDRAGRDAVPLMASDGSRIDGLVMQGDLAGARRGWRLIAGVIDHGDGTPVHNAILVGPDLVARKVWQLDEDRVPATTTMQPPNRKILHGMELLGDGSVVFAFTQSVGLQRWDACDRLLWAVPGTFHHSVSRDADRDSLWGLLVDERPEIDKKVPERHEFVELDAETGAPERRFSVADIMAANPDLAVFDIARIDEDLHGTNSADIAGNWLADTYHFNDVDPMPAAFAQAFPEFEAGDLLISSRTLNALMVVDPDDYRVKWHSTGETLRQHDPDWLPDGTISVLNNNMGRGKSEIVAFDPVRHDRKVVLPGEAIDFYTRIQGRQQRLPGGGFAVASPQQGRAFETDAEGRVVLEFFNLRTGTDDEGYVLTEYHWYPEDAINQEDPNQCASR